MWRPAPRRYWSVMRRCAILIVIAMVTGCWSGDEPDTSGAAIQRPVAPQLPMCTEQNGSSCTTKGRSFGCDNGTWHPPGRPGHAAVCICDGRSNTCG